MTQFTESLLHFSFPDSWLVIKSDEHRFYRYLSGNGLKGVDFMALVGQQLILIEVKNYEDRYPKDEILPSTAILNQPNLYAQQFIQKFEDSLRLIRIVQQYYQRRFWFRFSPLMVQILPKRLLSKTDWYFWNRAFQILEQQPEHCHLWLWLEMGKNIAKEKSGSVEEEIQQQIKVHFAKTPYLIAFLNSEKNQETKGMKVSRIATQIE